MNKPVLQRALGESWGQLPAVLKKHFTLNSYSDDNFIVRGEMLEVYHSLFAKLFIPVGILLGAVVPYIGQKIPIKVSYSTSTLDDALYMDRCFSFKQKNPFHFKTRTEFVKPNEVI